MVSNFGTCEAEAETADAPNVVPDLHWCSLDDDTHTMHRCSCGLEWAEEPPC